MTPSRSILSVFICLRIISSWGFLLSRRGPLLPNERTKNHHPFTLFAKSQKKNKKKNKNSKNQKGPEVVVKSKNKRDFPQGGAPPNGLATNIKPAYLAGIEEDHAYEQFFYHENSQRRLFKIVQQFEKPLLMCNPSLAVMAEEEGHDYMLLDRDTRFKFLKKYREFSLLEPFLVPPSYKYDAIFIDPPFANVTPKQLAKCLKMMAPNSDRASVPVYVGYNSDREEELIEAFAEGYDGPKLERKWSLEYQSCTEKTNDKIWFYGPIGPYPC